MAADLVGPYVFAYADLVKGKLWLARDPVGNRTLYYYSDTYTFLVASEEQALLPLITPKPCLDPTATAHFFASVPCGENTFFQSIKELLPGWMLTCDPHSLEKFPFSNSLEPEETLLHEQTVILEQLTQKLSEAVSVRLNSESSTGIMLSSGTDSSTLAALSNHNLHISAGSGTLMPISYRFDAFQEANEGPEIKELCHLLGLQNQSFDASSMRPFKSWQSSPPNPNTPEDNLYRPILQKLYGLAAEQGCQVLLTGAFGDHHFAGSYRWLLEALQHGKWRHAFRNFKIDLQLNGLRTTLRRSGFGSKQHLRLQPAPPRYLTQYAASMWSAPALYQPFNSKPPIHQGALQSALAARSFSREQYYSHRAGIELRHPYRDRQLIALSQRLPAYYLYQNGTKKWWLKQIRNHFLPMPSQTTIANKNLEPFYQACLTLDRHQIHQALRSSEAIWSPWIEPNSVYQSISEHQKEEVPSYLWWLCLSFSKWYQYVF